MKIARPFNKKFGLTAACLLAASIGGPAALAEEFTLISAVPDDVFLCVAGRGNAEREFIEKYWNEVIGELCASGIGADLMGLMGGMLDQGDQAELDRLMETAHRLYEGVDWAEMGRGEMVFAERLADFTQAMGTVTIGVPDMVWLMRGSATGAEKNYTGLIAILETIVAEVNKAAGAEVLTVSRTSEQGASVASIDLLASMSHAPSLSIAVGRREEVIFIVMGQQMIDDVIGLLAGTSSKTALSTTARFKNAFVGLPQAEDGLTFFDMQNMLASLKGLGDQIVASVDGHEASGERILNTDQSPEASAVAAEAFEIYETGDIEKALEVMLTANSIEPADSRIIYNVACLHALLGHRDDALTWVERAVEGGFYMPDQWPTDSDLDCLLADPRYKVALDKAKQASPPQNGGKQGTIRGLVERVLGIPGMIDYSATVLYTNGYSTYSDSVTVLTADAKSNPFYAVFSEGASTSDFSRYLPVETVSFSIDRGIDLTALYTFLEDTVRMAGPDGEQLIAQWTAIQENSGFNVRKDLLSWIKGDLVTVTLGSDGGDASVWMMKVSNESAAKEKLTQAIGALTGAMSQLGATNPMMAMMMAMMTMRTSPSTNERLAGFTNVFIGMSPAPVAVAGVADGHLILGSSAESILMCLDTAAGEHPNIRQNAQAMAELLTPTGAFTSVGLQDQRNIGQEIAAGCAMISVFGGIGAAMIPDPQAQKIAGALLGIIGKIGPIAQKVDFYKSTSSTTTFDGKGWYSRSVTHYRTPAERTAVANAEANGV